MTMGVTLLSVVFNTVGARHLPLFESLILVLHIVGFFAVIITLGVLAPKVASDRIHVRSAILIIYRHPLNKFLPSLATSEAGLQLEAHVSSEC